MASLVRNFARYLRHIVGVCLRQTYPKEEQPVEDDAIGEIGDVERNIPESSSAVPRYLSGMPPPPPRRLCPISLVPLERVTTIECNRGCYSIVPFATYLIMSHPAWLCPLEHNDVEESVVLEIDEKIGRMRKAIEEKIEAPTDEEVVLLNIPTLMTLFDSRHDADQRAEAFKSRERAGILRSLTSIMDNLISEIYDVLENDAQQEVVEESKDATEEKYESDVLSLFSEFNTIFDQLCSEDPEYAYTCLRGYISFLNGPKRRPTKDPRARLPRLVTLLEGCFYSEQTLAVHEGRRRLRSADF